MFFAIKMATKYQSTILENCKYPEFPVNSYSGWWLNDSFEKYAQVKLDHLPQVSLKIRKRFETTTVDGKNLANHLGCIKNVDNGINYQPQLVITGFQPSTVVYLQLII